MCGICGFTGATEADLPTLKAMCDVMAHRGPDGEGQYLDDGIALGHRRLSLIDLEGGNQPMVRATGEHAARITSPALMPDGTPCASPEAAAAKGDFAIVFNGEIYNYRDLRAELEAEGWAFQTSSDTEVLLTGYLAWGEAVLDRLRGMFAFAIWNRKSRELFCARDFFGIKPFYYTVQDGAAGPQFIFASEIKCILEHPAYQRELNEEALEQYLCFQFSALDETFFKGIFKLPPAHCMTVRADGTTEMRRYWRPEYDFDESRSREDTVEAIDAAMRESVRYHNVADVEVGSFLSSGIDSSYMAACLAKENPAIKTFTVGFAEYEGERDEISWARELADELHIENSSKHIGEEEYWASLPRVQWHMDEPSADPSAVALYFVDQIAAEQVKAVLSGEGADEFFGGYRIYQTPFANQKLSWAPKGLLKGASKAARALGVRGANYLERASETPEDWYYTNANGVAFSPAERERLRAGKRTDAGARVPSPQELIAPAYAEVAGLDDTTRMQYVDLFFWLVGDILLKTDKMSMAHSLESRVPFLDKQVFDVSATIPTRLKANDEQTKLTLREAAERAIPKDWAQKEKLGFPVPMVNWLRQNRYYNEIKEWFTGDIASKFFNTDELVRLLDEHKAGADRSRKIWIVYMFLMWYKTYFVDQKAPEKPAA
ncbi:asparagine synthase (glutamine-hydrolyzing) [Gordonibacter urolithinfaciens]|uniref:asparagine synthase (glutamine-hydrolyzing) n=1 Tax=Gordonibacter urolithinfaciens TaxID=1335613 RepID=A0A6N8ILL0_9ACTN|nr:asparagine synthase (glutamine-hydrolyzing) [Gordonibacter urolithinfaciens]MVM54331.1 asparagine synthase (glutamine-hydrolyzing) [Gordonibacter urolithinfaciens]MVN16784.1 asparagine synthase (glutamine-hydrolyzing) [Gordonibacter urolithinfaciens]MVN38894.1 asparagine synthase (glutamine-hydrolyzing) [Gordonibacter urolithinfaciens]MVN56924.1 asparagine synthase (glutamine-hydrolyzing) [Gordonibacter urolithinfaciens]MVN61222.1 asparagine synthase (glutamine-hydrolyzing) [Gordonibacter u